MNVRVIPRTAAEGYLKLVRLPLDTAIGLLPGNGTGAGSTAKLALDRADASVRMIIASILGDPVLSDDAQRRRAAADQRAEALALRVAAERKSQQADSRLEQRHEQVARQRRQANQRAEAKRKQATRKREQRTSRAAKAESERLDASRRAAERVEETVNGRAPQARLDSLDAKAVALREKEQALTARDEARRLREASARAKSERKNR